MHITFSKEFTSPIEAVFAWIGSPEQAVKWMKSVTRTEITHATPEVVGTRGIEYLEEGGEVLAMNVEVTAYDPPRGISFSLDSRVNQVEVRYQLEEVGERTRLNIITDIRWKFPVNVMSMVMGGKMRKGILAQLDEETEALRGLCEGER